MGTDETDVCGVVIIANIIRVFFWLGERFELGKPSFVPS